MDFVVSRQNPYKIIAPINTSITPLIPLIPLHNILTGAAVDRQVTARLLDIEAKGAEIYQSYRKERLIDDKVKISAMLHMQKPPLFNHRYDDESKPSTEKKPITITEIAKANRHLQIAQERGMPDFEIMSYDLLEQSPIFDSDAPATPTDKAKIVTELEDLAGGRDNLSILEKKTSLRTVVFRDFMSCLRRLDLSKFSTFGKLVDFLLEGGFSQSDAVDIVHMIVDSYLESSFKDAERLGRAQGNDDDGDVIDIVNFGSETPIPKLTDKFFRSALNKQNLGLLVRSKVIAFNKRAIASGMVIDGECLPAVMSGGQEISDLQTWTEEADMRQMVHINWEVKLNKCERVLIKSNDADSFMYLYKK